MPDIFNSPALTLALAMAAGMASLALGATLRIPGILLALTLGATTWYQAKKGGYPRLPAASFDRIFLVHMYHEVTEPYAFLWRMRSALRPQGQVIVVDVDRQTDQHGIPPRLLFCEFGAVGFRLAQFVRKPELRGYYAQFEAADTRPEPSEIEPCGMASTPPAEGQALSEGKDRSV